jgi:GT2 family glycosyltransferase
MKLCVIILNYFGHDETLACAKGLLGQNIDRIIIVENSGSRQEEDSLSSALGAETKTTVMSTGKNLGFAGGVNFAVRQMLPLGFDAFLLLNNDTVVPVDLIDRLVGGAEKAVIDIASPVVYEYPRKDKLWSAGHYYNIWTGLTAQAKNRFKLPGDFFYLRGCCLLVRCHVFETAGLLDEDFFMYGEEVDFCYRAVKAGYKTGIVPDAKLYHKVAGSSTMNSPFYEYHIVLSHFLLCGKTFSSACASKISLIVKTAVMAVRALKRSICSGNAKAVKAYIKALTDLKGF